MKNSTTGGICAMQRMEYIDFANTQMKLLRIGLGTWAIGGWMWGGTDERESIRTIHAAIRQGITLIDTAPICGFGRSKEIVGRTVDELGERCNVIIATKVGLSGARAAAWPVTHHAVGNPS